MRRNTKSTRPAWIAALLVLLLAGAANAWKEFTTHFQMSSYAPIRSRPYNDILNDTRWGAFLLDRNHPLLGGWRRDMIRVNENAAGFTKWDDLLLQLDPTGRGLQPTHLIRLGAVHEDSEKNPFPRFVCHFHNPFTGKGLDPEYPLPRAVVRRMGPVRSSIEWANGAADNEFDLPEFLAYAELAWTAPDRPTRVRNVALMFFTATHPRGRTTTRRWIASRACGSTA